MITKTIIGKWNNTDIDLVLRRSDDDAKWIHKVGTNEDYESAVDPVTANVTYIEIDKPATAEKPAEKTRGHDRRGRR